MESLRTVAVGLLIVFVDVGGTAPGAGDWVPDPLGWVMVLAGLAPLRGTLPSHRRVNSTAGLSLMTSVIALAAASTIHQDPSLEWAFSLPTLLFCVFLCHDLGSLSALHGGAARTDLARRFRLLRTAFVAAGALPALIYGPGWSELVVPAAILVVAANIGLLWWLWQAGGRVEGSVTAG